MLDLLIAATLLAATPLLLAALGEIIAERSGTLNLGIEGLILTGAGAGFAAAVLTGNGWIGLAAAIGAAVAVGLVFAVVTVVARADQIVAGTAVNLLAIGGTGAAWAALQAHGLDRLPAGAGFQPVAIPGLPESSTSAQIHPLTVLAFAAVPVLAWLMQHSRIGLIVRAVGEDPAAAAAAGIAVRQWRVGCILVAAACAGLAGAWLSLIRTHGFQPGMSAGKGFVVLALVILGRWRPGWVMAACLGFALVESAQQLAQASGAGSVLSWRLFQAAPYAAALLALAIASRASRGPAALGKPW
jgi:simple sugar transport system permease protein